MTRLGSFKGRSQPMPMMTIERLRECEWERATRFTIPSDWPSGIYLGKLSREEPYGAQSYVIFAVKEMCCSDILFQVADLTWQAYNKWPGKNSLYDDGTPEVWYVGPNVRVSFDRPYAKYCQVVDAPLSVGSGSFLLWKHPLAFWLEKEGYDVRYCSNVDLHLHPQILDTIKVLLSIGHDEYWSRKMFDEVVHARDQGLSIAFLSGDALYTEIEFYSNSITGASCRAFARKQPHPGQPTKTGAADFNDEQKLMGVKSYGSGYGDWVVTNADHWIYDDTSLESNDSIPGMIGFEFHGTPADISGSK